MTRPSGRRTRRVLDRSRAIAVLERALRRHGLPRVHMTLIVVATGAIGFLASTGLLALGVSAMPVRYPAAVLIAYGSFLLLLRWWASHQRGRLAEHASDALAPDVGFGTGTHTPPSPSAPEVELGGGGSFGGGGAAGSWDDVPLASHSHEAVTTAAGCAPSGAAEPAAAVEATSSAFDVDLDEAWILVVPAVIVVGAAVAALAVVWTAPVLFAEVLLDVALVSGLYRRLQHLEPQSWLRTAVRRTWLPAAAAALIVAVGGLVAQHELPDARSVGDVVRALRS